MHRANTRVGKAKRAHHRDPRLELVGTAQERLCPPYEVFTATTRQPFSSRSTRVSDSGSITKRSACSGARSRAMASTARMVPECTTRIASPAGRASARRWRARSGRQNFRRRAVGCWRPISRIRDRPGRARARVRCDAVRSTRQNPVRGRRPVRPQRDPASRPSPACDAPDCTPQMRLPAILP